MKFQIKNTIASLAIAIALASCSKNDPATDANPTGTGSIKLEFDQVYGSANFAFGTEYKNSNGETVTPSKIEYIVSNIVLTKKDGSTITYPKSKSYFIVDESIAASQLITLTDIPAGDYTSVKFGVGVDKAQWELGATGQGDFLTLAQNAGMMWSWTGGYKFLAFEGAFKSATVTSPSNYRVHTGKTLVNGVENYNYVEMTLNFPKNALVRTTIAPQLHILADVKKVVDGVNKIALSQAKGGDIMGGSQLALVSENLKEMFFVEHVHNN